MNPFWLAVEFGLGTVTLLLLLLTLALAFQGEPGSLFALLLCLVFGFFTNAAEGRRQTNALGKQRLHYLDLNPEIKLAIAKTDAELSTLEQACSAMSKVAQFGSSEESRKYAREKIEHLKTAMEGLKKNEASMITELEKEMVIGDYQHADSGLATDSRREAVQKCTEALSAAEAVRKEVEAR